MPIDSLDLTAIYNDDGYPVAIRAEDAARLRLGLVLVLFQLGPQIAHTGTTAQTLLVSVPLPARLLGKRGSLRVFTFSEASANNANVKAVRLRISTAQDTGGTIIGTQSLDNQLTGRSLHTLHARDFYTSQTSGAPNANNGGLLSVNASAAVGHAIDLSVPQFLNVTCELGSAADTVSLRGLVVEVLPQD